MGGLIRTMATALACSWLLAAPAHGQFTGYIELVATDFETATEDASGQLSTDRSRSFLQLFNCTFDRSLWPNLRLRTGGFFERRSGSFTGNGDEIDSTTSRLRPFFTLTLRMPVHAVELGYERSENRQGVDGQPSNTAIREAYYANMAYTPVRRPHVRFDYFGTSASEGNRLVSDTREDRFQLSADYRWKQKFQATYRGALFETRDRLTETDVRDLSHATRLSYSDSFLGGRMRLGTDYRVTYRSSDVDSSGGGELRIPVARLSGSSSIDDTPLLGIPDSNPALIDGNRTASAGLNLGLPAPGADDRPRNLGLDLASATELNTLLVWVDRELPPEINTTFAWQVYVSADNENWTLHQSAMPAPFGTFLRRFQIEFDDVTTRYIKLVVEPLRASVPFSADYPSIAVTELEAERRRAADGTGREDSGTSHLATFDLRTQISSAPAIYHEATFFLTRNSSTSTAYTLSNGLSLSHRFSPIYAVAARLAREDKRERAGDSESLLYTASLRASATSTLEHRLVFSGRDERGIASARDTRSAFIFNSARLYRGVDLNLGIGTSSSSIDGGQSVDSDELNATATIIPHAKTTLNLSYRDRTDEVNDPDRPGLPTRTARAAEISVAQNALATLYFFGSYRVERRTELARRTYGNYSVNWSPFRDGTLQVTLRFNETLRSEDDAVERVFGPRVRWNFARGSYVDLAYQELITDSNLLRVESNVLSGSLRYAF